MSEDQRQAAVLALRSIAARAAMAANSLERHAFWPGELADAKQQIHRDLASVPDER
jgi:hypothetical protein